MSYDLSIWCVEPFTDPASLPDADAWVRRDNYWSVEGKGWLLNAGPSDRVLPEDIPEEVTPLLPGIEHVVHLSLEPIHAPAVGFKMLRKTAKTIAKASRGAIRDPQGDTVELASGTHRYESPKREKDTRVAIIEMSWWFDHARLLERASLERFLRTLRSSIPEGMPRRYGLYEPPQHELEKTGEEHLVKFLLAHLTESVVWYAKSPVAYVFISIKPTCGWQKLGSKTEYRCNRLSIELESATLEQPGWRIALYRAWKNLSIELSPFYGDVRTLRGYFRHGRGFSSDGASEPHPTKSWWWKGIPPRLGHAVVLGDPYLQLWPEFAKSSEAIDGIRVASMPDWRTDQDVTEMVGAVPVALALPFMPHEGASPMGGRWTVYPEEYPPSFPFEPPSG